jgi:hypothetical protein
MLRQALRHTRVRTTVGALQLLVHFMLFSGQACLLFVSETLSQEMTNLRCLTTHVTCLTAK